MNEFSGSWEHRLPRSSSFGTTFVLARACGTISRGDDQNVTRDPVTGALTGRPFPQHDAIRNTYNPNYTWQQQRSLQFLVHAQLRRQLGRERELLVHLLGVDLPDAVESDQHGRICSSYGISPEDVTSDAHEPAQPRAALDLLQAAVGSDVLGVLHLHRTEPAERDDRDFPLELDGAER